MEFRRGQVRDGPPLFVQLTNDVWFGVSAASRQLSLTSVLRGRERHTGRDRLER